MRRSGLSRMGRGTAADLSSGGGTYAAGGTAVIPVASASKGHTSSSEHNKRAMGAGDFDIRTPDWPVGTAAVVRSTREQTVRLTGRIPPAGRPLDANRWCARTDVARV